MDGDRRRLDDLVNAAFGVAYSRQEGGDDGEEWDSLRRALVAATEVAPPGVGFRDGYLVRTATMANGELEEEACGIDDIEQVAHAIEDLKGEWFVIDEIADSSDRRWMTTFVAIEFLRQHGLVRDDGTANRFRAAEGFDSAAANAEFAVAEMKSRGC